VGRGLEAPEIAANEHILGAHHAAVGANLDP